MVSSQGTCKAPLRWEYHVVISSDLQCCRDGRVMGPGGPQSAALVISECQTGILDPARSVTPGLAAQAAERGIVARIAGLADAFRAAGLPVVHCHIAHRPDLAGVRPNSLLGALSIKNRTLIDGTPD